MSEDARPKVLLEQLGSAESIQIRVIRDLQPEEVQRIEWANSVVRAVRFKSPFALFRDALLEYEDSLRPLSEDSTEPLEHKLVRCADAFEVLVDAVGRVDSWEKWAEEVSKALDYSDALQAAAKVYETDTIQVVADILKCEDKTFGLQWRESGFSIIVGADSLDQFVDVRGWIGVVDRLMLALVGQFSTIFNAKVEEAAQVLNAVSGEAISGIASVSDPLIPGVGEQKFTTGGVDSDGAKQMRYLVWMAQRALWEQEHSIDASTQASDVAAGARPPVEPQEEVAASADQQPDQQELPRVSLDLTRMVQAVIHARERTKERMFDALNADDVRGDLERLERLAAGFRTCVSKVAGECAPVDASGVPIVSGSAGDRDVHESAMDLIGDWHARLVEQGSRAARRGGPRGLDMLLSLSEASRLIAELCEEVVLSSVRDGETSQEDLGLVVEGDAERLCWLEGRYRVALNHALPEAAVVYALRSIALGSVPSWALGLDVGAAREAVIKYIGGDGAVMTSDFVNLCGEFYRQSGEVGGESEGRVGVSLEGADHD